jgi:hypothetical protein
MIIGVLTNNWTGEIFFSAGGVVSSELLPTGSGIENYFCEYGSRPT